MFYGGDGSKSAKYTKSWQILLTKRSFFYHSGSPWNWSEWDLVKADTHLLSTYHVPGSSQTLLLYQHNVIIATPSVEGTMNLTAEERRHGELKRSEWHRSRARICVRFLNGSCRSYTPPKSLEGHGAGQYSVMYLCQGRLTLLHFGFSH